MFTIDLCVKKRYFCYLVCITIKKDYFGGISIYKMHKNKTELKKYIYYGIKFKRILIFC